MAFRTPASGRSFNIPEIRLHTAVSLDFDGDGLGNLGEFVLGTDLFAPDTDGDGVPDGAEVRQGTDPLDGLSAATGIIASAPTVGPALDLAAFNNLVVVAEGAGGVGVFNVFNGMSPSHVSHCGMAST